MEYADKTNLFDIKMLREGQEEITVIYANEFTRIERIVSNIASSPDGFWYDQDEEEWVSILSGEAEIEVEGKLISMRTGDSILIPAHTRHRVVSTSSECIWLCVFTKVDLIADQCSK